MAARVLTNFTAEAIKEFVGGSEKSQEKPASDASGPTGETGPGTTGETGPGTTGRTKPSRPKTQSDSAPAPARPPVESQGEAPAPTMKQT